MTAPFTITIRVFESDNGWSWQLSLWTGTEPRPPGYPPDEVKSSPRAYRSPATAWNSARAAADRMVR